MRSSASGVLALALVATIAVAPIVLPVAAADGAHPRESRSVKEVLRDARKARRPVMLEFYTTWCGPCKRFARDVLARPRVQRALRDIEFVRYDAEKHQGLDAAFRYEVESYPQVLLIDAKGELQLRFTGVLGVEQFLAIVEIAPATGLDQETIEEGLREGADPAAAALLAARWHAVRGGHKTALGLYEAAAKADEGDARGLRSEATWEALRILAIAKAIKLEDRAPQFVATFPASSYALDALVLVLFTDPRADSTALATTHLSAVAHDAERLGRAVHVLLAAGEVDAARLGARLLVEREPRSPGAHALLAEALHQSGKRQLALVSIDQAIKLATDEDDADELDKARDRYDGGVTTSTSEAIAYHRALGEEYAALMTSDHPPPVIGARYPGVAMARVKARKGWDLLDLRRPAGDVRIGLSLPDLRAGVSGSPIAVGSRGAWVVGNGAHLGVALAFDAQVGSDTSGHVLYDASAMLGVGGRLGRRGVVALTIGGGLSGMADDLPFAWQVPLQLTASCDLGRHLRADVFARPSMTFGEATRDRGAPSLGVIDELVYGAGVRIGRRRVVGDGTRLSGLGVHVGFTVTERRHERIVGLDLSFAHSLFSN